MKQPKYLKLAGEIEQAILNGALLPGARLPSVRELMAQQQVSLSTVTSALRRLEEQGFVEPRAKSGYFVKPRAAARPELPSQPRPAAAEKLDVGAPAEDLFPTERFRKLIASLVRRHPDLATRSPRRSTAAVLARQLARRCAEYGCFLRETDIVLTHGDTEAMALALRACAGPGESILLQAPVDPWLARIMAALGVRPWILPEASGACLVEAVAATFEAGANAAALLINPSFHYPTGRILSIAEKRELLRICCRFAVPIIEDDRFGDLQHEGVRPLPIKAFDTGDQVIYLSSCCRSLAPGLQIGWLAAGAERRTTIDTLKSASSAQVSELSQLALAEFLERGSHAPHLRTMRRQLKSRLGVLGEVLSETFGAAVVRPVTGGYCFWLADLEPPSEAEACAFARRWPELFGGVSPVLAFIERGLCVNASHALGEAELDALAECCIALRNRAPAAGGVSLESSARSVSAN